MTKTISTYEAPALLDSHNSMTRLALYERLSNSAKNENIRPGINAAIAPSVMSFAADDNGWSNPMLCTFDVEAESGNEITCMSRAYKLTDNDNIEFVAEFAHLAAFMYNTNWAKSGRPPEAYQVQAQWSMYVSGMKRHAFVVLSDRRINIFWTDRNEAIINRLKDAVSDMETRLKKKDPPPIDSTPEFTQEDPDVLEAEKTDIDTLCDRYQSSKMARADSQNTLSLIEHSYEVAKDALLKRIKPGESHEYEGIRISHNAKTNRLTEEKIDGQYF